MLQGYIWKGVKISISPAQNYFNLIPVISNNDKDSMVNESLSWG